MALFGVSNAQKRALADRGYRWVQTIRRLQTERPEAAGTELASILPRDDVHMLMLALQHLCKCVSVLRRAGSPLPGAKELLAAWAGIKDVRNAFEHEEDFILKKGRGDSQERVVASMWWEQGLLDVATTTDDDGLKDVLFMGRRYEIRPAIQAALELDEPLLALARALREG